MLNNFEQRTQVPKTYAVLGALLLLTILHTINPLAAPVSNLVGWALPAYLSFKAIESPSTHDDVQWLTYWVVFGFFNFLESFALRLVLYYLPWYFAFKTIFIIWLQLPAFRVSPPFLSPCRAFPCYLFFFPPRISFSVIFHLSGVAIPIDALAIVRMCSNASLLQGAQVTYLNVLKPVLNNISSQSRAVAPTTSTAEVPVHNE